MTQPQNSLVTEDRKYIWHPYTPLLPEPEILPVIKAEGCYLHLADGRKILDAVSSWWVNLHGHSHPYLANALYKQALALEHIIFAGFTHPPAVALAKQLLAILPDNQATVFYSDNGSTAVEVALKMAFQYWHNTGTPRKKVIALQGAYHGDTFGAMSVGGRSFFTEPFVPFLFEVEFVDAQQWTSEKAERSGLFTEEVAAFIYEPLVQGAGGMKMYPPQVLDEMMQMAHSQGIVCVADEVMTGFGRTGELFASGYLTEKPDIVCLSKGLTGGMMPLGVTTCTADIVEAFRSENVLKTFFHGHSYTANPLACAVAGASLDLLLAPECQADISRIAARHEQFAQTIRHNPRVREVRHLGTILAIEIETGGAGSYVDEIRNDLYRFFLNKNLLLRPLGNVIYIMPPYVITDLELENIYNAITELLEYKLP